MSAAGMILSAGPDLVVPTAPPSDQAVAANFERFDGLTPLDHPAGQRIFYPGGGPRPGSQPTPDTYTPGPQAGLVNTLGGQPLPVSPRITRPPGETTYTTALGVQFRTGVGQNYQGVAQTVALADITNNPPVPDSMSTILGGWG